MGSINSPVRRWLGSVVLPEYLNWPQFAAWREGALAAAAVLNKNRPDDAGPDATWSYDADEWRHALLAGVCGVVLEWHLAGLPEKMTPETFPTRPLKASQALFNWLVDEISKIVADEDDSDPKG